MTPTDALAAALHTTSIEDEHYLDAMECEWDERDQSATILAALQAAGWQLVQFDDMPVLPTALVGKS